MDKYDYNSALNLLTSSGKFRISLGLDRISAVLNLLGNPQDKLNCIHVAGTNGKGSVCSIIASILNQAGKRVGLYTSPHIFKYTERIKLASYPITITLQGERGNSLQSISDDDFAQYVFEINKIAKENRIDLTEFEILTAVMFKYFVDNNADVVVLETGLGGRYDATNVIKNPLCSVITHIDYDHTERLGDTLDKIAYEKAGIMKPNCPCIVCEGREVYYDVASEVGALLEIIAPCADFSERLALKGNYQQENLSLALAVIEKCFPEIPEQTIEEGLRNVRHPFRFQYFEKYNLIIDGAHNPNGINSLIESLDIYYPNTKRRFIFGCLKNKDYKKMVSIIAQNTQLAGERAAELYFYHFSHQNSAEFETLQAICPVKAKKLNEDTKIDFNDGYLNIICGSFYMIAEIVDLLGLEINV